MLIKGTLRRRMLIHSLGYNYDFRLRKIQIKIVLERFLIVGFYTLCKITILAKLYFLEFRIAGSAAQHFLHILRQFA